MPFTANAWRLLALGKSRLKSASRCEIPAARYVVDDDNSDSLGVACEGELKASAMIQHAKMLVQNAYLRCVCMTKCAPDRPKKGKKKPRAHGTRLVQGWKDSNPRPTALEAVALPTELRPYRFATYRQKSPKNQAKTTYRSLFLVRKSTDFCHDIDMPL